MKTTFLFRDVARVEFKEATAWHEGRQSGLGAEFVEEVEEVFDKILRQPDRYPIKHADVREALVSRFPYAVYYRLRQNRIVIVAVIHCSRDPNVWQARQ